MSLKIVSWNVNGIRAAGRKGLVDIIKNLEPGIVCLQETKAHKEQITPELRDLNSGFASDFSKPLKKGYSGVATFYPESVRPEVSRQCGYKTADEEGRILEHRFKNFTLLNIYYPSGTTGDIRQDVKYKFLDYIQENISKRTEPLVICGDYNICLQDIDIHHPREAEKRKLSGFLPEERAWFKNFISSNKLIDSYRHVHGDIPDKYTWWTYRAGAKAKNKGWRIDYILVSESLKSDIVSADIYADVTCSDHCPISLTLGCDID